MRQISGAAMTQKVEFGSAAWMAAAERLLSEVADEYGARLTGLRLAGRDVYTGAPPHLGGPQLVVTFGIDHGRAFVVPGAAEPADMVMEIDYAAARTGARTILGKTAEDIEARRLRREAAVAAGVMKVQGSVDGAPLVIRQALVEWHNRLAELVD